MYTTVVDESCTNRLSSKTFKETFAKILESIKVNDLYLQLQYNGMPLPLRQWFVKVIMQATLKKLSYLENFPAYM